MFQTDVKYVFDFIRCAESKEKLYELVSTEPYYQAMDEDSFDIVSMYTNATELIGIKEYEGKDGKKDVCQAIKDLMADSRQEGREEGIKEVIAEKIGLPLEQVKLFRVQI